MAPPQPGDSIRTPTFMRSLSRTGEGYGMGSRRRSSRGGAEWPGGVSVQTVTTSVSHTHDDGDGEGLRAGEDDGVGERTEGRTLELVELPATSDFLSPLGWKAKERLAKDSIADGDLGRTVRSACRLLSSRVLIPDISIGRFALRLDRLCKECITSRLVAFLLCRLYGFACCNSIASYRTPSGEENNAR